MYYIQHGFFFTSGGDVDYMLVSLSLIKQIIKDTNLMWILFSVRHVQRFGNRDWIWPIYSNLFPIFIHIHLTHSWWKKNKSHDKKQKDQRNYYMWTIIFQMDGSISVLVKFSFNWSMRFCSKCKLLHLQCSLYAGVYLI